MGILRAEWIRLRSYWVGWAGLFANVLYLVWQLQSEHTRLLIHMSQSGGANAALFWSGSNLLPFVFTWAGRATLLRIAIWAIIGALWTWTDWRSGLPTEHVTKLSKPRLMWSAGRLISISIYTVMLQLMYIITAYVTSFALHERIVWQHFGVLMWLMGMSALICWVTSILGFLFTALWLNPLVGAVTVWVIFWLRGNLQTRINQWLIMHLGAHFGLVVTWMLTALDPFNNVGAIGALWSTWGNRAVANGGWTSLFFAGEAQVGVPLGSFLPYPHLYMYSPGWFLDLTILMLEVIAVFCKDFFLKVASDFSIVLQLHFPQCCKLYFPGNSRGIRELQTFAT